MTAPLDDSADYYLLALAHTKGVGPKLLRRLMDAFGDTRAIFKTPRRDLARHVKAEVAERISSGAGEPAAEKGMRWAEGAPERRILTVADEEYPQRLMHVADAPLILYACGKRLSALNGNAIAVVGSRSASAAGVRNSENFARALSERGIVVASGMAHGVDAAAHEGALAGGAGTVAVVATGLDIVYPREHRILAQKIQEEGVIVGELPPGTPPDNRNFPPRNRIISGISLGCLVTEAGLKSGALITARHSLDNGREVFAVPGSINSPMHRGCHYLIKKGAKLAETVADITEEINLVVPLAAQRQAGEGENASGGDGDDGDAAVGDSLLAHIGFEPTATDDIAGRSGLAAQALLPALLELEMAGKIAAAAGGKYQRLS